MLSLEFSRSVSIADAINAVLLLMAIVGILLTFRQIRETKLIQKATFFKDLYTTLYGDSEVRDAFYRVEYGEFTYDDDFHGSEGEKLMDRLLSFADLVCYLREQKMLTDGEMEYFRYQLLRLYRNKNVAEYIAFLEGLFHVNENGLRPFRSFISYCEASDPNWSPTE